MNRPLCTLAFALLLSGPAVLAQEEAIPAHSEVTETQSKFGDLSSEKFAVKPLVGSMFYDNTLGDSNARIAYGFTAEYNFAKTKRPDIYLGPSTGFIFSHFGAPGSNFFGSDAPEGSSGGDANTFVVPIDAKLGKLFADRNLRTSIRAGANLIYRSNASSTIMSSSDLTETGSIWKLYPNLGADVEFGPLMVRGDWTIAPENDLWSAALGVIIPIG